MLGAFVAVIFIKRFTKRTAGDCFNLAIYISRVAELTDKEFKKKRIGEFISFSLDKANNDKKDHKR